MNRDHILAVLYDLTLTIGGETRLDALLPRILQRLLYHTGFSAGFALLEQSGQGLRRGKLAAAVGDHVLARQHQGWIELPENLLVGPVASLADRALLASLPGSRSYAYALRLPVDAETTLVLLSPIEVAGSLPFVEVFQPVLRNLGKAIKLCRDSELLTSTLASDLAASRQLLQTVIDTVPIRVFWKDREGRYLGCNPVFARDAGKASPTELIGRDDYAMGWAAQADLYRADDQAVMHTGQMRLNFEEPQTTPDGKTIWLRTSKVPLYDQQGEVMGVLGVYDDITEHKREERRLAMAMEAAKILIWELDFTVGKLGYDGSALASLGLDASDAPDTLEGWLARVYPDDRPRFLALVEQALLPGTERGFDCEYRFQGPNDNYLWLQTVGRVAHRDATGHPLLGAGYTVNIDARKQAEVALKASEEAQRTLIAALPDVIMRFDPEGRHLFISENALEATGLPAAAFIGKTHLQMGFPEPMCAIWEHAIQQPFLTGRPHEIEFELDGPAGRVVFNGRLTPDADADGRVNTVLAVARDITKSKRVETELRKLSLAMEQSPESIVITNLDAEIEYVNAAFVRNTGYRREEVIGRNPRVLHSGKTPQATFDSLWQALTTGEPWQGEFHNRRRDGSEYIELAIITPLRQADGKITHYVAVKEDITEKKRLGEELDAHRHHLEGLVEARTAALSIAKEAAEAANRAKSAFLANMSHELRTPMNGVMGMINIAKRRMTDAKGLDQLDKAKLSAERLLGVLNDILDIAKIEAERMVLEDLPLQLAENIDTLSATFGHKASEKGLRLAVDIPPQLAHAHLKGDPLRLGQILFNLVGNAIKFTEQGEIVLRARTVGETSEAVQVRFEVVDTGIGINAEAQTRLFQSFEQADNSMTRKYGGTGLGLAICKRLVQLMGGEIGADSVPGTGSTFWFVVPLKKRVQSAVAPAPSSATLTAEQRLLAEFAGTRVLLAEDEPITQDVSRFLLEDVGFIVDIAADGQQALELARQNRYALILMDMQMPVLNGVEATQAIRADSLNQTTPILAMTANAFDEDRDACLAAGMNEHISKPVDPQQLHASFRRWLEK